MSEPQKNKFMLKIDKMIKGNTPSQVRYMFDRVSKNSIGYQRSDNKRTWTNDDTKEIFTTLEPAYFNRGLPVYIVCPDLNFSPSFIFKQNPKIELVKQFLIENKIDFEIISKSKQQPNSIELILDINEECLAVKEYTPDTMEASLHGQAIDRLERTLRKWEITDFFTMTIWTAFIILLTSLFFILFMLGS